MPDQDKPLPKPPGTPFGRKRRFDQEEERPSLMADQMAMAMAEGRLDEFMEKELPDNEHARTLARMMLGMTGMLPCDGIQSSSPTDKRASGTGGKESGPADEVPPPQPPEEVVRAVHEGDVRGLMELLRQEHRKRVSEEGQEEEGSGQPCTERTPSALPAAQPQAVIERELIDQMIRIAADNSVSPDWIMMRALKLYIEEYQKTGRL